MRIDPRQPHVFFALGWTYDQMGRTAKAIEAYRQTLLLDPNYTRARKRLETLESSTAPPRTAEVTWASVCIPVPDRARSEGPLRLKPANG